MAKAEMTKQMMNNQHTKLVATISELFLQLSSYSLKKPLCNNSKMIQSRAVLFVLSLFFVGISAFGVFPPTKPLVRTTAVSDVTLPNDIFHARIGTTSTTQLHMSSLEKTTGKTTKKGVKVIDKIETKAEEQKKNEEMWRVVLHNDEVHTFNYVIRSLCKVVGTLDRKAAFEICVQTHGIGKSTVTKTWKKQAEQFCLGLQRQGLTVSISPDKDFDGGHSGGGL